MGPGVPQVKPFSSSTEFVTGPFRRPGGVPSTPNSEESERPREFNTIGAGFKVGSLCYPIDLLSTPLMRSELKSGETVESTIAVSGQTIKNYTMFFITVQADSASNTEGNTTAEFNSGLAMDPDSREELNARVLGGAAGAAAGIGASTTVASIIERGFRTYANVNPFGAYNNVALIAQIAGSIATLTAGAATAGTIVGGLTFGSKEKRTLKQVIALHTPNDLRITYGVDYADEDSDFASMIGTLPSSPTNYAKSLVLRTPGIGGALQRATGIAPNPKTEVLFQNVKFRTFTFTYDFFPRSYMEADNVREIIKMFKLHMHPEFAKGSKGFQYVYPSEFDIQYYTNGSINEALPKHTRSVLTDMDVNYAPSAAGFTAFESGMPTQITMTLTFKELALLTKQDIEVGF